MNEKRIVFVIIFLAVTAFTSLCGNLIQQGRIQRLGYELDSVRNELNTARDREQIATSTIADIRDGLTRTGDILHKSTNTVADIRRNIHKLEEIFNEMEGIINNHSYNNGITIYNAVEEINE